MCFWPAALVAAIFQPNSGSFERRSEIESVGREPRANRDSIQVWVEPTSSLRYLINQDSVRYHIENLLTRPRLGQADLRGGDECYVGLACSGR